jgi:hypothetical protein
LEPATDPCEECENSEQLQKWLQKLYSRTGASHLKENENGDVKEICGEDNYKKTLPERLQRGHWKYYGTTRTRTRHSMECAELTLTFFAWYQYYADSE